eukprot:5234144-Pleurochrysis_carterae.AAC.2
MVSKEDGQERRSRRGRREGEERSDGSGRKERERWRGEGGAKGRIKGGQVRRKRKKKVDEG